MKKTTFFLPTLLILIWANHVSAQTPGANISAKIDRYIKFEMRKQKIPGVSLAVVRNGKIAILKSYGFANLEHQVPVKPETIFQSGSIGKQFTAAAILLLVERGRLSLDDRITKFFPDAPPTWKDITVEHLLNHTSGLGDYPPAVDLRRDYTEDEFFEHFKKAPLSFAPGSDWDYSNVGYVMLGFLIRKVTGQYYGDFVLKNIFQRAGMTTARIISEADLVPNRASGYRLVNGELKNQEWVSPSTNSTADGSYYLSVLDLAKWDAALYSEKLLRQVTLARAWTPSRLSGGRQKSYGFGWHTDVIHKRRVMFHGGAWQGFKSFIVRFPDDKLTLMYFANSWETKDCKLARGLAAIFYPEFALPSEETISDAEPKTTVLVRRVLLQLSKNSVDSSLYTPEFQAALTPDRVASVAALLNSLSLPIAIIHTNELVEHHLEGDFRVRRYLLNDLGQTLSFTVKVSKDDKIAGFEVTRQ
jgi:CubicO group peptidase (beta-lactamase class C family)